MGLFDWFKTEPDTVEIPLTDARQLYAEISGLVKEWIRLVESKVLNDQISAGEALKFAEARRVFKALDYEVRQKIDNPKAELDVQKILKILEVAGKLVGVAL